MGSCRSGCRQVGVWMGGLHLPTLHLRVWVGYYEGQWVGSCRSRDGWVGVGVGQWVDVGVGA